MTTLTLEQLLELHALVVKVSGGNMGLRDLGRLEAAIATQTQNVFGEELYPALTDKAAAMIRAIIADHPFVDGNKRTAMLAGLTLLQLNSFTFFANMGEIEDLAVKTVTKHIDVPNLSKWLRLHNN